MKATKNTTMQPLKQYFHCRSCGFDRPIEQLGKITKGNNSKRCQSCCNKADAAKKIIDKGKYEDIEL